MTRHPITLAGIILGLFAIAGSTLVALTYEGTHQRIAENERQALLTQLHKLVPSGQIDNDIAEDFVDIHQPEVTGLDTARVYLARRNGRLHAAIFNIAAPEGYSGPINLLVGIHADGRLAGVRVVSHKETPGLGDKIDESRSDWVHQFTGRSLGDPPEAKWKVKRDGGVFDQFTGATITPRTIVNNVRRLLIWYRDGGAEQIARLAGGTAQ